MMTHDNQAQEGGATGIPLEPDEVIRTTALGWLNAWTYDYADPQNFLRDTSVQVRNNADRILGEYLSQLRKSLAELRQRFPSPTRENPFPPAELLDSARSLESYIRRVEGVRTTVIGASIPPRDLGRHSGSATVELLLQLRESDRKMIELLSTLNDSLIAELETHLAKRNALLGEFAASFG